jgi:hypothetical protein
MGLDVGAEGNPQRPGTFRHSTEVRLQAIAVEQQRGRGEVFDTHLIRSGLR